MAAEPDVSTPAAPAFGPRANKVVPRPPMEAVLPRFAYAILVAEALALAVLYLVRDPRPHEWLGQWIGWIGTASMIVMHVYSIRRRVRALSRWGRIGRWLQLHIFLGLQGALLVTFHSLHLTTWSNLSGATLVLTLIVVASGIFGRYLFSMLPKGMAGERLDARQVEAQIAELLPLLQTADVAANDASLHRVVAEISQPLTPRVTSLSFGQLVSEDRNARTALRSLDAEIKRARSAGTADGAALDRLAAAARRRAMLLRRLGTLASAERFFRGWTLFHRPLTFILFGTVALHVISHYLYSGMYGT